MPAQRFLLRPASILTTPRKLAEVLNIRKVYRYPSRRELPTFDVERDFILSWPRELSFANATELHTQLCDFYRTDKPSQRFTLAKCGVSTPEFFGGTSSRFVVRPLRHYGGNGFRITEDPNDYEKGAEYICPLYAKTHEYRLVYSKGKHLITLLKKVPEGTPVDTPWNHSQGSSFVTLNDWSTCRLRHTSVLEDIAKVEFLSCAHLIGVDVMYNKNDKTYAVCEVNFCPSLTIESNLERIKDHALA